MDSHTRCPWANQSEIEQVYHDTQWGKPVHNDKMLFQMLILEGQQAGLSWSTILKKYNTLCKAYDDFDPQLLAHYSDDKIHSLLENPGIIRNRLKVNSAVTNARAYLKLASEMSSLDEFLWGYVDFNTIQNAWTTASQVPSKTELSDRISKDLKKLGFKFVGSTIVYSLMQSIGMVNDHLVSCDFYSQTK